MSALRKGMKSVKAPPYDLLQTFCRADYLEIHIKRHLGQKDEKCPECGKGFVCKSDLIRHKLNVHSAFGRFLEIN